MSVDFAQKYQLRFLLPIAVVVGGGVFVAVVVAAAVVAHPIVSDPSCS
jgi:hypothetical protein